MNNEGYPRLYAPDPATMVAPSDIVSLQSEINNIDVLLLSDYGSIVLICPAGMSAQRAFTSPSTYLYEPFYDLGYGTNRELFTVDHSIGSRFVLYTKPSIYNPGPCGLQWETNPLPIPYATFEVSVSASFLQSIDGLMTVRLAVESYEADGTSRESQFFGQRTYPKGARDDWSVHTIVNVQMPRVTRVTFILMSVCDAVGSIYYGVGDSWGENQIIVKRLR